MSAGCIRPGVFMSPIAKLCKGIWPWNYGVRARLPQHFKTRYMEQFFTQPAPVHYKPDPAKFTVDQFGVRQPVQNIPLPITFPEESQGGLWGGEGIILGLHRKRNNKYKPCVPRMWKPKLIKRVFYSEILDEWMAITVTPRTLDLIDQAYGFDFYILQTHSVNLCSKLGMRLKREMLLTLARKSFYPDNPAKRESVFAKYKDYLIPEEEADWIGLSLEEAEIKQEELEEEQRRRSMRPLKEVYMEGLLKDLAHRAEEDGTVISGHWLNKLNPFQEKPSS